MHENTATQTVVVERKSWEFRGKDIVRSSHDSLQELLETFAASLLEPDPANRLVVSIGVKHRDERGPGCTVGLNILVGSASQLSSEHNVWIFTGPDKHSPENRVELLFDGNGLVLVSLIKTAVVWSSPYRTEQLAKS